MRASKLTSARRGTLCKVNVSRVRRLAIIKGSAAFLAPLMGMVPVKRWPPTMRMRSMAYYSLAPLPQSLLMKTPVFVGGRTPVRPVPTVQSTPSDLTLSPLIAIPWGFGFGLSLAFQQVGAKLASQPGPAFVAFGLFWAGFVLGFAGHRSRTYS